MAEVSEILLEKLGQEFGAKMAQVEGQVKEGKVASEDQATELKNIIKQFGELKEEQQKFALKMNRQTSDNERAFGTLKSAIHDALTSFEGEGMKSAMKFNKSFELKDGQVHLSTKAVGDITNANLTGGYASRQTSSTVIGPRQAPTRMRDFINTIAFTAPVLEYPKETGFEGGAGFQTAEGALKPTFDLDLTMVQETPKTIAILATTSTQALDDIPYLSGYLSRRMYEQFLNFEDDQIINGNGAGQNFKGLINQGQVYVPSAGYGTTIYDKFVDAIAQMQTANYNPDGLLISPLDYGLMLTYKSTDGVYNYPALVFGQNGAMSIYGVPIHSKSQITKGTAILADFSQMDLAIRSGLQFATSYDHSDNFARNKVTYRLEGREVLAIYDNKAIKVIDVTGGSAS